MHTADPEAAEEEERRKEGGKLPEKTQSTQLSSLQYTGRGSATECQQLIATEGTQFKTAGAVQLLFTFVQFTLSPPPPPP